LALDLGCGAVLRGRGSPGFARSRDDITALGDSFGNMLTSPVRDAPPMARSASLSELELPQPQPDVAPPREPRPRAQQPRPNANIKANVKANGGEAPRLIKADRGAIELDGHDVTKLPMYQRARLGIGYLPQEASIFRGLTVEQNIRAVLEVVEPSRKKRERELDALLDEFNVTRLRKSPSIALSGGERRRVEIARALATRPNYMLLDEPFAGIDPIAVGDIQDLVRHLTNRGIGVLITDHNVRETLGLTDRAYIVYAGQILTEGSPEDIVNDPDVRRLYLGEEFRL
jgi:lipopolysaccharide export system ATP-binding protein